MPHENDLQPPLPAASSQPAPSSFTTTHRLLTMPPQKRPAEVALALGASAAAPAGQPAPKKDARAIVRLAAGNTTSASAPAGARAGNARARVRKSSALQQPCKSQLHTARLPRLPPPRRHALTALLPAAAAGRSSC
jgi:hypothetical protein